MSESRPAEPTREPPATAAPAAPPKAGGHPDDHLIPRAALFGNPERDAVQISPDGKHLSSLAAKHGVMNVFVAPIDHLDQAKPITNETTRPITVYFWALDKQHVLYRQDSGGDENFHLFRADLTGGAATDLTPYKGARANVLGIGGLRRPPAVSERKPGTIVIGLNDRDPRYFDVYDIDIATGKRTLRYQNDDGFGDFTFDANLELVFATKSLPDGGQQIFKRAGKRWKLFDTIPFEDSETTVIVSVLPGGLKTLLASIPPYWAQYLAKFR